jgi:hypothetical protein
VAGDAGQTYHGVFPAVLGQIGSAVTDHLNLQEDLASARLDGGCLRFPSCGQQRSETPSRINFSSLQTLELDGRLHENPWPAVHRKPTTKRLTISRQPAYEQVTRERSR